MYVAIELLQSLSAAADTLARLIRQKTKGTLVTSADLSLEVCEATGLPVAEKTEGLASHCWELPAASLTQAETAVEETQRPAGNMNYNLLQALRKARETVHWTEV